MAAAERLIRYAAEPISMSLAVFLWMTGRVTAVVFFSVVFLIFGAVPSSYWLYFKGREALTGSGPPWSPGNGHEQFPGLSRLILVPAPSLLFLGHLIPFHGVSASPTPWFFAITNWWFAFSATIFHPAALLAERLGFGLQSWIHLLFALLLAILLTLGALRLTSSVKRHGVSAA